MILKTRAAIAALACGVSLLLPAAASYANDTQILFTETETAVSVPDRTTQESLPAGNGHSNGTGILFTDSGAQTTVSSQNQPAPSGESAGSVQTEVPSDSGDAAGSSSQNTNAPSVSGQTQKQPLQNKPAGTPSPDAERVDSSQNQMSGSGSEVPVPRTGDISGQLVCGLLMLLSVCGLRLYTVAEKRCCGS